MSRFAAQRLAVLVDTAYVYHGARTLLGGRLDYRRLLDFVIDDRSAVRAIAFVVQHGDADVSSFLDALQAVGFEVRVRPARPKGDGVGGGDWDVGLALTAAAIAPRVDVVALVAGSGAFVDLIDHLEVAGTRSEVYAFDDLVSPALVDAADGFTPLEDALLLDA